MKIIFAPDSFKGALSSVEVIHVLEEKARKVFGEVDTAAVPMADGGEGTIDALIIPMGGEKPKFSVTGPTGDMVEAELGLLKDGETAVVEMAQASGLSLIPEGKKDPLTATSYGTGELIRIALDKGYKKIIIGIGGSATNDGGMGAMEALGGIFLDDNGNVLVGNAKNLAKVKTIDLSRMHGKISECWFSVICDVKNPLLGENGATYIYGPQKGITPDLLEELDRGMANYVEVVEHTLGKEIADVAGAGAAGGLGAALYGFLNAELRPGVQVVLDTAGFERLLEGTSFVVTGEGNIDRQSILYGKVPQGIMECCARHNIPVLVVAGGMGDGAELFWKEHTGSIMTTVNGPMTLEYAMKNARVLLENAAERMFLMVKIGMMVNK